MVRMLINNWWLFACRAAFAFVFAVYIWFVHGARLPWLLQAFAHASVVVSFGILAIGAGLLTLAAGLRQSGRSDDRWLLLVDALGTCAAGVVVIVTPSLTLTHLVWIMTFWVLFTGACEILMARNLRRHLRDEWFLRLAACVSLLFGVCLILDWRADESLLLAWLGWYALFSAMAMSGLAWRLWYAGAAPHRRQSMPVARIEPSGVTGVTAQNRSMRHH